MAVSEVAGAAQSSGAGPALHVSGVSKTFGAQRVLNDVTMTVGPGEIRALVGENGSGKSTLVKVLAGYHEPDDGAEILVSGGGLRFVHQDLALVGSLNAVENLGLGRGFGSGRGRPVHWAARRREARKILSDLGYTIDVDIPVSRLQASERTAVAVARAVTPQEGLPSVLVLDEPTANLPGAEVDLLFALVRRVRDSGVAVVFVSHHLNEVFDLADTVTVLRSGDLVGTYVTADLDEETLIEKMVGHEVDRGVYREPPKERINALDVRGVAGGSVTELSFDVARGEIVGVAGITGSGREVVAPLLFGGIARTGTLFVSGEELKPGRPDASIAAGMGLIPAERFTTAVVHGHDVSENVSIARPKDFVRAGVFRRAHEASEAMTWLDRLDVRPRAPRQPLSSLSGGNAQKVILARWLRLAPRVLVLDEPTQGVDVGSKEDIHRQIETAAAAGCAVVVCSTDSEELARLCSSVHVFVRGQVAAVLASPLSADQITSASLADPKGPPA